MTIDDFKAWVTEGKKNEPATQELAEDVPTNEEMEGDEFFTEDESKYMDEADSISREFGDLSEEENKQVYNIVKSKVEDRGLKSGAAIQINNKQKVLSRAKNVVRDRARIESDGAKASAYYEYKNQIKSYKDGVEKTGLSIAEADAIYLQAIKEVKSASVESDEILFRDGQSETDQIKSEAEKNGTFLKAPNGKDSNLNEKQWLQVRTKAFKEWFGDWENDPENASKVVDENGEPLVVYHGSRNGKFDVFDPSKGNPTLGGGMYFSDSIELANKFAGTKGFVYSDRKSVV